MTDKRTDGRTDEQTELRWLRRAKAVAAFARKNDVRSSYVEYVMTLCPVFANPAKPKKRISLKPNLKPKTFPKTRFFQPCCDAWL